jgi:low affinity Fe/Cu permease
MYSLELHEENKCGEPRSIPLREHHSRSMGMDRRAPFFAFCLLLVVAWMVQGAVLVLSRGSIRPFLDAEYQLEINTTTTIITFLMLALLQNSQTRNDQATQHTLNEIAGRRLASARKDRPASESCHRA